MEQKNFKEGVFLRRPERKRAGTHGVGKSPKKSHFTTLRAKRATFTFPSSTILKGQTVLPDRFILIGQKLVKMPKSKKVKMRHFG